jgi:hypothetical protein
MRLAFPLLRRITGRRFTIRPRIIIAPTAPSFPRRDLRLELRRFLVGSRFAWSSIKRLGL